MTCTDSRHIHDSARPGSLRDILPSIERMAGRIMETLWLWSERAGQRRQLARLDAEQLHDIGISRTAAAFEADKPFWRE